MDNAFRGRNLADSYDGEPPDPSEYEDRRGEDLTGADLSNQNLYAHDFRGSRLTGVTLKNASLHYSYLSGVDLSGSELTNANFYMACLTGAKLSQSTMVAAKFYGARLQDADLSEVDARDANLSGADLTKATLVGANLERAALRDVVLTGAVLTSVNMRWVQLAGGDFTDAILDGADFSDAEGLDKAIFAKAQINASTRGLPPAIVERWELGLQKSSCVTGSDNADQNGNPKRPWTDDEENLLRELLLVQKLTYKQAGAVLGRDKDAVSSKARAMGIRSQHKPGRQPRA